MDIRNITLNSQKLNIYIAPEKVGYVMHRSDFRTIAIANPNNTPVIALVATLLPLCSILDKSSK